MAQTTVPAKNKTLRAIPRRPRLPQSAPTQRMHQQDIVWMALFAIVSMCLRVATTGIGALEHWETYLDAATVVLLYFLGFRVRDRATAVIAAALLATSPLFSAAPTGDSRDLLFVVLTIAALALYAAGLDVWAVVVASGATIMRPEGILLGAVLLGFMFTERRPGWVLGTVAYFVLTFLGLAGMVFFYGKGVPIPVVQLLPGPIVSLFSSQTAIVAWFIWPMLADMADPARRTRWKPVVVWSVLFLCIESLVHFTGYSFESGPFRPILFLLAAGGISRLLPVIAGDFANPTARYAVAVLAIGTLIFVRAKAEWTQAVGLVKTASVNHPAAVPALQPPHPPVHRAATAAIPHPAPTAPVKTSGPAVVAASPVKAVASAVPTPKGDVPGIPHHVVFVPAGALAPAAPHKGTPAVRVAAPETAKSAPVKPAPAPLVAVNPQPTVVATGTTLPAPTVPGVPATVVAEARAAGVPTYTMRHGRSVPRNLWAIRWDIDHRPKMAAKPPSKPAATVAVAPKPVVKVAATPPPQPKPIVKVAVAPKPLPKQVLKPAPKPVVVAKAPAPAKPVVPAIPAVAVTPHPISVIPGVPLSLAAEAAKAGVPVYYVKHGRNYPRTLWAIRWDISHKVKSTAPSVAPIAPTSVRMAHRRPAVAAPAHVVANRRHAPPRKRHRSVWAIRWNATHRH